MNKEFGDRKLGGLILAGGASRRMGRDKALLDWAGRRAVDLTWDLAAGVCDGRVLIVGRDYGHEFVADHEPLAGPVAGLMTGARALKSQGCTAALVLAVDAPTLTADDLMPLLSAPLPGAVYEGLPLPMVLDITALPTEVQAGMSLRQLVTDLRLAVLPCPLSIRSRVRGANDSDERAALLADFTTPKT